MMMMMVVVSCDNDALLDEHHYDWVEHYRRGKMTRERERAMYLVRRDTPIPELTPSAMLTPTSTLFADIFLIFLMLWEIIRVRQNNRRVLIPDTGF